MFQEANSFFGSLRLLTNRNFPLIFETKSFFQRSFFRLARKHGDKSFPPRYALSGLSRIALARQVFKSWELVPLCDFLFSGVVGRLDWCFSLALADADAILLDVGPTRL